MIKALNIFVMERTNFNPFKAIYNKWLAHITPNSGVLKSVLRPGMGKNYLQILALLFNIALKFLTRSNRQEGEIKSNQIRK